VHQIQKTSLRAVGFFCIWGAMVVRTTVRLTCSSKFGPSRNTVSPQGRNTPQGYF
jgi:hypothetical protein